MLNDSTQPTANGLFKSISSQATRDTYDLALPTKMLQLDFNEVSYKKILNQQKIKFEFSNPIKISIDLKKIQPDRTIVQSKPRTHLVIVDQAPFSVFKSVKSQESSPEEKPDNKLVVINSNRDHPYNNSIRPSDLRNGQSPFQLAATEWTRLAETVSSETDTDRPENEPNQIESDQACALSVPQEGIKINRNSSSNAILAQVKSLGPNFRSIFIRPKVNKKIDPSFLTKTIDVLSKKKLNNQNSKPNSFDYVELLKQSYNSRSTKNSIDEKFASFFATPKELNINQSVDDILKKFSSQQTDNTLSKETSFLKTSGKEPKYLGQLPRLDKWTCMICLSKHLENIDVCTICGSSRPELKSKLGSQSISFSKPVRKTSSKMSVMDITSYEPEPYHKSDDILFLLQDDTYNYQKSIFSAKPNPYIKKWTCQHCNYSNDSLKIVCLNCRWVKTAPLKSKQGLSLNESLKSKSRVVESGECDLPLVKKSRQDDQVADSEKNSKKDNKEIDTPKEPVSEEKAKQTSNESLSSLFAKAKANKWECSVCMASNDQSQDQCVCCSTGRPGAKKETKQASEPKTQVTTTNSGFNFGLPLKDSTTLAKPSFSSSFGTGQETVLTGFSFKSKESTDNSQTKQKDIEEKSLFKFTPFGQAKPNETDKPQEKTVEVTKSTNFGFFPMDKNVPISTDSSTTKSKQNEHLSGSLNFTFNKPELVLNKSNDLFNKDKLSSAASLLETKDAKLPTGLFDTNFNAETKKKDTSFSLFSNLSSSSSEAKGAEDNKKTLYSTIIDTNRKEPEIKISNTNLFGTSSVSTSGQNFGSIAKLDFSTKPNQSLNTQPTVVAKDSTTKPSSLGLNFSSVSSKTDGIFSTNNKEKTNLSPIGTQVSTSLFNNTGSINSNPSDNLFKVDKVQLNVFPSFGTPAPNNSANFGSLGNETNKVGFFGSQNLDNKSADSLGSSATTNSFFNSTSKPNNVSNSPFGSMVNKNHTNLFGTSSQSANVDLSKKPVQENSLFGASKVNNLFGTSSQSANVDLSKKPVQENNLFGLNNSTFGEIKNTGSLFGDNKSDDKTNFFKIDQSKNLTESPFTVNSTFSSANTSANMFGFGSTSTPAFNTPNQTPFGSAISTNSVNFLTPEISSQKSPLLAIESSSKRAFSGNSSPNNSIQNFQTPTNAQKPAFNFSNQANPVANGEQNFNQNMNMNFNFGETAIGFSGSNEQSKQIQPRRFKHAKRHYTNQKNI